MNAAPCIHYDPQGRKGGCELGRIVPRDCRGCPGYEPDLIAAEARGEDDPDAVRRVLWQSLEAPHG